MSYEEYRDFPVEYKRWLVDRINKEIKAASDNKADIPTKAPHHNTPDIRTMTGKTKPFTPNARMQRFT